MDNVLIEAIIAKAQDKMLHGESVDNVIECLLKTNVMPTTVSPTNSVTQCVKNFSSAKNATKLCHTK